MLVAGAGREPTLLDFFVEAPGRRRPAEPRAPSWSRSTSRSATRSRSSTSAPASVRRLRRCRRGSARRAPPVRLAAARGAGGAGRARWRARASRSTPSRPTSSRSSAGSSPRRPSRAALFAPDGRPLRERRRVLRQPELGDALERLGAEGAAPFYAGDVAAAVVDWLAERGGMLTAADLARLRGRRARAGRASPTAAATVLTNPPPSAGGILIAYALALLDRAPEPRRPRRARRRRWRPRRASARRSSSTGSTRPASPSASSASRLGLDTHIAVARRRGPRVRGDLLQRRGLRRWSCPARAST